MAVRIRLYQTPALPNHYVARRGAEGYIVPKLPVGREIWTRREEYRGEHDHSLTEVPDRVVQAYGINRHHYSVAKMLKLTPEQDEVLNQRLIGLGMEFSTYARRMLLLEDVVAPRVGRPRKPRDESPLE
jgi:hypothetical protein